MIEINEQRQWQYYKGNYFLEQGKRPGILRRILHKLIHQLHQIDDHMMLYNALEPNAKLSIFKFLKIIFILARNHNAR